MAVTLGGSIDKDFAIVFPVAAELKYGTGSRYDGAVTLDAVTRYHRVGLGVGLDLRWPTAPQIEDVAGTDGRVSASDPQMFGYSGIVRILFGPMQRAFLQGRVTQLPADYAMYLIDACSSQYLTEDLSNACYQGQALLDRPDFNGGSEYRLALGYLFAGETEVKKVLRLQWTHQDFDYSLTGENINGAWNRGIDAISVAIGFVF